MKTTVPKIQMVDLLGQYAQMQDEVDQAVLDVIRSGAFINGPAVRDLQTGLEKHLAVKHVVPCANGTDALQIALMALNLQPGDEVIVPAFTYVATAEVIALLQLKPVMVDVDPDTFNVTAALIEAALTEQTRAIVPVNLFGQCCDLAPIMELATKHGLHVVEDNAQAIGAEYTFADGHRQFAGTVGHIGCTSFYPSKNLGAYGDAGALYTNDDDLATACRAIANHGQSIRRYYHDRVGVNSRLDSIQAAILNVKLARLEEYNAARRAAADYYDAAFADVAELVTPVRAPYSTHVFHQYTVKVTNGRRDALQAHLQEAQVPSMIYYPVPLYAQEAYQTAAANKVNHLPVTDMLCQQVISLPMHSELTEESLAYIAETVRAFFAN